MFKNSSAFFQCPAIMHKRFYVFQSDDVRKGMTVGPVDVDVFKWYLNKTSPGKKQYTSSTFLAYPLKKASSQVIIACLAVPDQNVVVPFSPFSKPEN